MYTCRCHSQHQKDPSLNAWCEFCETRRIPQGIGLHITKPQMNARDKRCISSKFAKKPKKPSQLAAQSMTWSLEYRFRARLTTCKISIEMGRRLRDEEPCTRLTPLRRRWSCKQLIRRSGNPLLMWRDCTALIYTLMDEWLKLLLLLPLWPSKSMPRFSTPLPGLRIQHRWLRLSANNVAMSESLLIGSEKGTIRTKSVILMAEINVATLCGQVQLTRRRSKPWVRKKWH